MHYKCNEEKETLTLLDECLRSSYSQTQRRRRRVVGLKDESVEAVPANRGENDEFARATTIDMLRKLTVEDPRFKMGKISRNRTQSIGGQRDGAAKAQSLAEENALAIEEAFDHEVADWEMGHRQATEKQREQFANHLTEHFLCRQLDPLPSTTLVSATRRRVAAAIESVISNASSLERRKDETFLRPFPDCGKRNVLP